MKNTYSAEDLLWAMEEMGTLEGLEHHRHSKFTNPQINRHLDELWAAHDALQKTLLNNWGIDLDQRLEES